MDQAELYGRVIKVNQAKPQKAAGEKLGSKTAVWEQVSFSCRFFTATESTFVPRTLSALFLELISCACSVDQFANFLKTGGLRHQTQRERGRQDGHRRWCEQAGRPHARTRRFGPSWPEAQLIEHFSLLSRLFLRKPHGIQRGVRGVFV
jgi:hypothetical protein